MVWLWHTSGCEARQRLDSGESTHSNFHVARPKAALHFRIIFRGVRRNGGITHLAVAFPSFDMMTPPVSWGA